MTNPYVSGWTEDTALTGNEQVEISNASPGHLWTPLVGAVNFAGSQILGTSVPVTSSTTFVASNLGVNLQVGSYLFEFYLSITNGSAGGLKAALAASTATTSLFCADTWAYDGTTVAAQGNITALTSNLVAYTGVVTAVSVSGSIIVSAAGTFALEFAQNVSNATATQVNAGSNLWIQRVA